MRRFAAFACIDWSGQAVARPKGIAVARCGADCEAPALIAPTRGWSREAILGWLLDAAAAEADLLIGIDFSPSLPFVDAGGFFPGWRDSPTDARALWATVERLCANDPHLGAGGMVDDPEASRHFRRHDHRAGLRQGDRFGTGRFRQTEIACRALGHGNAQSCFNLVGAAQVGKSSLTGMRVLHRLAGRVPIWPFDPVPDRGPLIVEIYTTIAARAAHVRRGSKMRSREALDVALADATIGSAPVGGTGAIDDHSSDAILTAAWLRRAAADATLWTRPPAAIADTEGWTFGVPCTMDGAAPA